MRRRLFIGPGLLLVLAILPFAVHSEPKPAAVDGAKFFEKDVQPILQAQCFSCHGGGEKKHEGEGRWLAHDAPRVGRAPDVDPIGDRTTTGGLCRTNALSREAPGTIGESARSACRRRIVAGE